MNDEPHRIPEWQIPSEDVVLGASDGELELNKQLEEKDEVTVHHWAHTEEPSDGKCPYCGRAYKSVTWARNVHKAGTHLDPLDLVDRDYIHEFVHKTTLRQSVNMDGSKQYVHDPTITCGPHQRENPRKGMGL